MADHTLPCWSLKGHRWKPTNGPIKTEQRKSRYYIWQVPKSRKIVRKDGGSLSRVLGRRTRF